MGSGPGRLLVGIGLVAAAVIVGLVLLAGNPESDEEAAPDLRDGVGTDADPTLAGRATTEATRTVQEAPPPVVEIAGWAIRGTVHESGEVPVPGAQVTVRVSTGGGDREVGSTTTGDDGTYAVSLAPLLALSPSIRATSRLVLNVSAQGFQPARVAIYLALPVEVDEAEAIEKDLLLVRGGAVTGRVVNAEGQPVADATAVLVTADGKTAAVAYRSPDGRFALGVEKPGSFRVWCHSPVHGLGSSDPFETTAEGTQDLGDLVLGVVPTIEGRVVFADKTPIGGVHLYANRIKDAGDVDPHAGLDGNAVPLQVPGETGSDGRFRLLTFRPGTYLLYLSHAYGQSMDAIEARSGDHEVEIVVPLHRLTLRLLDLGGRPIQGCSRSAHGWMPEHIEDFERVVRGEVTVDEIWQSSHTSYTGDSTNEDGREVLLVPHGSAWIIKFHLGGLPAVEHVARVPTEGNESEVVLHVGTKRPTGMLEIAVRNEFGEPVGAFTYEIRTVFGSRIANGVGGTDTAEPVAVPTGLLKLKIWTGASDGWLEKECRAYSPYFPVHADAEVVAGSTTKAVVEARRGGWIRVILDLPDGTQADRTRRESVEVRIADADSSWQSCRTFLYGDPEFNRACSWIVVPEDSNEVITRLGKLFEPGRSELRVGLEGFKTVTVPVDVTVGTETTVRVVMEAE